MGDIEPIGHDVLAAHGTVVGAGVAIVALNAFLLLGLVGGRHPGDRDFDWQDRFDRTGEGHLHRPFHLPAVYAGRHHRAESSDVEEIGTHPIAQFLGFLIALRIELGILLRLFVLPDGQISLPMLLVQDRPFLNVDVMPSLARPRQVHIVAQLALEADVGDKPVVGFGVEARQVTRVRVAIGVAVRHVENQHEIVAAGKYGHLSASVVGVSSCLRKKSLRW